MAFPQLIYAHAQAARKQLHKINASVCRWARARARQPAHSTYAHIFVYRCSQILKMSIFCGLKENKERWKHTKKNKKQKAQKDRVRANRLHWWDRKINFAIRWIAERKKQPRQHQQHNRENVMSSAYIIIQCNLLLLSVREHTGKLWGIDRPKNCWNTV